MSNLKQLFNFFLTNLMFVFYLINHCHIQIFEVIVERDENNKSVDLLLEIVQGRQAHHIR